MFATLGLDSVFLRVYSVSLEVYGIKLELWFLGGWLPFSLPQSFVVLRWHARLPLVCEVKKLHGESSSCCYAKASFKFYATDDETKKKLEKCEVTKCGMSLVYVPEDDEECMLLKKTNLVQLSWKTEPSCSNGSDDVNIMDDVRPKRRRCQVGGGGEEPDHKRAK
ncbi:hypothetical protein F2Q68_00002329 [Brassica cretica]|uniref:Uncharacterized protein n=1 Tax=Brassica cretica TaxID=69181 RepID=A0A8S9JKV6_BRACR|nr:hypothetical protein F2Q68_00002329 [Brassica cretica]